MFVVPVRFAKEHKRMLAHAKDMTFLRFSLLVENNNNTKIRVILITVTISTRMDPTT
jgi:dephospho-CoA kinase